MKDLATLIGEHGAALSELFSHLDPTTADAAIDDLAAGIKEGADALRRQREATPEGRA